MSVVADSTPDHMETWLRVARKNTPTKNCLSQPAALPRRRAEERDSVILNAEHALGRQLHLMLIFEAVAILDHRRLRSVCNGQAQGGVCRFQVLLHQERGDVHRLADIPVDGNRLGGLLPPITTMGGVR